jgi:hypothetical protein
MTNGPGVPATNKCEHRFMWVDLQIKHLCAMKIDYEVEEELGKLPDDLATTYDHIYRRIQDDVCSAPLALNALMWILAAERPLSPGEWAGGVSWALPRPDGKSSKLKTPVLLDVCQNLVVHDGQRNVMRFAHLSVREFLEAKALDQQAAEMAASACLTTLQQPHTLNAQPIAPTDFTPFHRYSIRYWPEHVLRCDDNDHTHQLSSTLSAFMGSYVRPADGYIQWFNAAASINVGFGDTINRLRSTPPNPLVAAAYFGFQKVCSHLWEQNTFDPNFTNDAQETLLYLASSKEHIATVRLLLQNGADANHPTHRGGKAPLLAAIQEHYSKVLDLLLDAGAKFNSAKYGSIVLAGASFGNGAVMQVLLQRDATIEITEAIVTAAAENWDSGKEVMELLLQRDATIEITEAIVTAAASNGQGVMELLLQRDATIEITEAIVTAAAGNWRSGKEVMEREGGDGAAAAERRHHRDHRGHRHRGRGEPVQREGGDGSAAAERRHHRDHRGHRHRGREEQEQREGGDGAAAAERRHHRDRRGRRHRRRGEPVQREERDEAAAAEGRHHRDHRGHRHRGREELAQREGGDGAAAAERRHHRDHRDHRRRGRE